MTLRTDRLINLRKNTNMKQYELTEKLDLAPNQVSKYECGESNPTLESLTIMADLFNTTTDYLLGLSNIPHPGAEPDANADLTPDESRWLSLFRGHSLVDQKRLLTVAEAMRDMGHER